MQTSSKSSQHPGFWPGKCRHFLPRSLAIFRWKAAFLHEVCEAGDVWVLQVLASWQVSVTHLKIQETL